jgi:hypothetical protein
MWGDRQRRWAWKKLPGTDSGGPLMTEVDTQPKPIRMEDAWVKPALGGVVVQCPHPNCYKDWYSPVGGIRMGALIGAAEEHIAKKHR